METLFAMLYSKKSEKLTLGFYVVNISAGIGMGKGLISEIHLRNMIMSHIIHYLRSIKIL